jgi:hypothetical protein
MIAVVIVESFRFMLMVGLLGKRLRCIAQRKVEGRTAFGASLSNAMLGIFIL